MLRNYTRLITGGILLFHIAITAHAFYIMFADYTGWTIEHFHPVMMSGFTLAWLGIYLRKRLCAFAYFSLLFYELAMKLFFGNNSFGQVFGDVLFPIDLLFAFVVLLLYKQIFNERIANPTQE